MDCNGSEVDQGYLNQMRIEQIRSCCMVFSLMGGCHSRRIEALRAGNFRKNLGGCMVLNGSNAKVQHSHHRVYTMHNDYHGCNNPFQVDK